MGQHVIFSNDDYLLNIVVIGSRRSGRLAVISSEQISQYNSTSDESSSAIDFDEFFPGHQAEQPKSLFDLLSAVLVLSVEMIEPAPDTLKDAIFFGRTRRFRGFKNY